MLQLEKDLLEIQLQVSKWKPVVDKIMNPMYGYTRLDYIQSDENTYLNTEYTPNKETALEIGFKVSSTADNNICCSDNFGICIRDGLLCCMFGGDIISTDYVVDTDTVIELILSINGLFVNGEKILDKFNTDFNSSKELLVGAGYLDNEIQALNLKDIYYCRILDGEYYNIKSEEVDENGNLIMSVLNQVNNVEDEFTEFGGTDAEIKTTLDAVMNKTQGVSRFKDTIRNYIGAYQIIKDDTGISTNVGLWNCVDKTLYLATEGKFIDGDITLPYIELEYLQTTGTQYINTGISESSVYEFIYEFTPLQISGGNNYGSYLSGTLDNFTIGGYETLTRAYFRYRGAEKTTNISLSTSKKNTIKLIDNYFTVNESNLVSITTSSAVGTGSSNIFICSNGSKSRITIGKVYGLKLFNNNQVLLSHLIPVIRKSDNVVCMYDKVRKIFVENAGTGNFIAGPLRDTKPYIPDNYTLVEYIEANGGAIINTDYKPMSNAKIDAKFYMGGTPSSYPTIFGSRNSSFSLSWYSHNTSVLSMSRNNVFKSFPSVHNKIIYLDSTDNHNIINMYDENKKLIGSNQWSITSSSRLEYPLALFCLRHINNYNEDCTCSGYRIYYMKFYENNVLAREYYACKDSNGTPCIYDTIRDKTLYNIGSGSFKSGEIVN